MKLRSIEEADLTGKTVLYRAPYDIETHRVQNDLVLKDLSRLEATLPTLRHLLEKQCKIVILTYVGRPEGRIVEELRTTLHAKALSQMLGQEVGKLEDCIGEKVQIFIQHMSPGSVVMLENTRFHPGEMEDDDTFAQELAKNGDLIVFDAFPQAHRQHASVTGIQRHLPSFAGFYCLQEVSTLSPLMENPARPFTLVIGGAKISDKIGAINNLYEKVDHVLVGGVPAHVFLKAKNIQLGRSLVEEKVVEDSKADPVPMASGLLAKDKVGKIVLPDDFLVSYPGSSVANVVSLAEGVPSEGSANDIGPETTQLFRKYLDRSKTIFWSGPLGNTDLEIFRAGSLAVVQAMINSSARTVVAGGDTIAFLDSSGMRDDINVVSLAGGATLEFLSGIPLPGLQPLLES